MPPREEFGPAVLNGKLRYLSVSQVQGFDPETFGGCHRRWWFEKVQGVKSPTTKAQATGHEIHSQIEHYLQTGEDVLGMIPRSGKHFIPEPLTSKPGLLIEHSFGNVDLVNRIFAGQGPAPGVIPLTADGAPFVGFIDVVNQRSTWLDNDGVEQPLPGKFEVVDWKTSSSIEKYAKGSAELLTSVQMIGYAEWGFRQQPKLDQIRISHGYFQTVGRDSKKTTAVISIDAAKKGWSRVDGVVRAMRDVASETEVKNVEPTYESCTAYRGCPHKSICPRSADRKLAEIFGFPIKLGTNNPKRSDGMSVMEKMRETKRLAAEALGAAAAAAAPAAATTAVVVKPDVSAEIARLKAEEQASPGADTAVCTHCPAVLTSNNSSRLKDGTFMHIACPKGPAAVLPPDATVSTLATSAAPVPADVLATLSPEVRAAALAQAAALNPALQVAPGAQAVITLENTTAGGAITLPVGAAAEPVRRGPGRPRRAATTTTPAPGVTAAAALEATAATGAAPGAATVAQDAVRKQIEMEFVAPGSETAGTVAGEFAGIELYVNCMVTGIVTTDLDPWIADMCRQLAEYAQASDIRCAPEQSALGFSKWKGALAAAALADMPGPGAYTLSYVEEDERRAVVLAAIKPHCARFVRGLR